jgi:hypothetical protein
MCEQLFNLRQTVALNKLKKVIINWRIGVPQENIEVILDNENQFDRKLKDSEEYYYYSGAISDNTRDFCKYMLKVDKVYSKAEIDFMSKMIGFNIFEYVPGPIMPKGGPGGPNCKHKWTRFRGKFISTPAATDRQIKTLIERHIFI